MEIIYSFKAKFCFHSINLIRQNVQQRKKGVTFVFYCEKCVMQNDKKILYTRVMV